jgi:hypothetical protein
MDHASAVETYAAERYLLGELSDAESEAFEEHYFDCATCAEDVRHGSQLMQGGREIAREPEPQKQNARIEEHRKQRRIGWMQIAAAAVLAIGIALPQFIERDAPSVMALPALASSRDASAVTYKRGATIVGSLEIQPHDGCVRYELAIRDANGETTRELDPVTAEAANETQVLITGPLPVGKYTLSIHGVQADGNRTEVETRKFQVVE